jgi:DNA (cytosine-5)-methyltransferase 1
MNTLELFETYKIKKPIKLIELFAGYGSQALALERLGIDFEHHQVVEFDKYAIKTYNALHDTNFETQDITKLKELNITETKKYDYVLTYSFPCTDLSIAGKMLGMKSGTRSGLLWEVERLLKNAKELPQVLLMENVTQVHGNKFKEDFDDWVRFLAKLGYSNQWKDLNAKDYGIPQSRNRTFMVSILGDYEYHFPKSFKLKLKLKDMLENEVDEKYYLTKETIKRISNWNAQQDPFKDIEKEKIIVPTLTARGAGEEHSGMILINEDTIKGYSKKTSVDDLGVVVVANTNSKHEQSSRVYSKEGLSPTITTMQGGNQEPKVLENLRIRKITPREAFRLMGLYDKDIDKIIDVNSSTQLYKQAGNSIVVQVLEHIFKELL